MSGHLKEHTFPVVQHCEEGFISKGQIQAIPVRNAGGTLLRGLLDRLIDSLRRVQPRKGLAAQEDHASPAWQLSAASIVVVMTEIIYGASPAWQPAAFLGAAPPAAMPPESAAARADDMAHVGPAAAEGLPHVGDGGQKGARRGMNMQELKEVVMLVEEEWVREGLWGVPISAEPDSILTPQVPSHTLPPTLIQPSIILPQLWSHHWITKYNQQIHHR